MSTTETIKSFPFRTAHPFHIEMCGTSYCDGNYRINRPCSRIHCFEYIISGTGTIHTPSGVFCPSAGDVYFLRRGEDHLYYSDNEDPWTKIWFNVEGKLVDNLLESYGITTGCCVENCEIKPLFDQFLRNAQFLESQEEIEENNALLLHRVIQAMARKLSEKDAQNYSADALKLKKYIDEHYDERLEIVSLAEHIYRSPSQTIRIFRKNFGVTPYEYAVSQKIRVAKLMLRNTAMPIGRIANNVGFENEHYFSTVFKKRTNMTPSEYRRNG